MSLYSTQVRLLTKAFTFSPQRWSILIVTPHTFKILSPILSKNTLRQLNITSIFLLGDTRSPIKDANAIFFIENSQENISTVCNDIRDTMYRTYNLLFNTYISRQDLENIAQVAAESNQGRQILRIYDLYCDYSLLSHTLFVSNINYSTSTIKCANSLFSLFYTIGEIPHIICKNTEDEEISAVLMRNIENRNIIKQGVKSKPLLIIVNRSDDLITPLRHQWTYRGLLLDVFNLEDNRIKSEGISIDFTDEFWVKNKDRLFPEVVNDINSAVKKDSNSPLLQTHMKLIIKLMEKIKERSLDSFYNYESQTLSTEILSDLGTKGEQCDIYRFILLAVLKGESMNDDIKECIMDICKERQLDTTLLKKVEGLKGVKEKRSLLKKMFYKEEYETPLSEYVEGVVGEYKSIYVYHNGGATYREMMSLEVLSKKLDINIIYGGTTMMSGNNFIEYLKDY